MTDWSDHVGVLRGVRDGPDPDTPAHARDGPLPDAYRWQVPRSPLALAALATAAVPGLDAYDVRRSSPQGAGIDAAVVVDAESKRWVVRSPQDARAGAALEAEVALLQALAVHVDAGRLPFAVPRPAGFAQLPEGGRAVVHAQLPGRPLQLELLGPGPGLAAALGRAIAALHELPLSTADDAGVPVYDADAYRRRRLAEVDEAARTGHVPPALLRRWEAALEDVALWRFQPTLVHGDLSADHVLCSATEPTGVLGWSEAKVADPADDLAWLLVAAPHEAVDPILEAYTLRRTEMRDRHLPARALLAGELALARWLLHGVRSDDQSIIDDATAMLRELESHAAEADPAPAGPTLSPSSAVGEAGPADPGTGRAAESTSGQDRPPHEADDAEIAEPTETGTGSRTQTGAATKSETEDTSHPQTGSETEPGPGAGAGDDASDAGADETAGTPDRT
ncbi:MAG: aminoglycoside phosphotransferase [Actinotalea sp.]|nr:aminoglycoside phosphotransferase [Actinotalea sp.]